jgi:hypothetical protein
VDAIEHTLMAKIKSIFCTKQTHFRGKKYLVKYKAYHQKEIVWMKFFHFDHLPDMVIKFEQEKGHELRVKRIQKKKKSFKIGLNVDEGINPF